MAEVGLNLFVVLLLRLLLGFRLLKLRLQLSQFLISELQVGFLLSQNLGVRLIFLKELLLQIIDGLLKL